MLLPSEVIKRIEKNEVDNIPHLIARLQGEREYPIKVSLKAPTIKTIMSDIASYENFLKQWRHYENQNLIERVDINYRYGVHGDNVPSDFVVHDFDELLSIISPVKKRVIKNFLKRCDSLAITMHFDNVNALYSFYRDLTYEVLTDREFSDLLICLPQLKRGLGKEHYLRAIPLLHIDTKFVEKHDKLILALLKALGLCNEKESLEEYLEVEAKPDGFAHIRILDDSLIERYSYMMVPTSELYRIEPPGDNLIVVENVQSGLMLPKLKNTSVIFGCGRNLSWAKTSWLSHKQKIIYWGDVDSWGFQMLCEFRDNSKQHIVSTLMDTSVFERQSHLERMVHEDKSTDVTTDLLTDAETKALSFLQNNSVTNTNSIEQLNRLEQEKLDEDLLLLALKEHGLL